MRWVVALAALAGFASVAFGAFAAHGVTDPHAQDLLSTGSFYGFVHALAAIACVLLASAGWPRARFAAPPFLAGVLVFSGTLYAMALGAPRILGAVTPLGGLAFMAGWLLLAWSALRRANPSR
jgi:uncharacterized membrane protein YgdD (TMEM256/DUF423 family)